MRKHMLIVAMLIVLTSIAGCGWGGVGETPASQPIADLGCTEHKAMAMVKRSEPGSSISPAGYQIVGGGLRDGWLFSHTAGFAVYVGPGCDPWFPITVGALVQKIQSASYSNNRFVLIGIGSGSDASTAPTVTPYRLEVNPATGLETVDYNQDPIGNIPGVIVMPLYPDKPPTIIRSIEIETTPSGFRVIISTDLPKRTSFALDGGFAPEIRSQRYDLTIDGAIVKRVSVPRAFPFPVTISTGLPPNVASVYSPSAWRALPKTLSTSPKSGENALTLTIDGISRGWMLTSDISQGTITLTFSRQ